VAETAILSRALDLADFQGRSELLDQVTHAAVTGGSRFVLDLVVPAEVGPSLAGPGPIPTRVLVLGNQGDPLGEVVVWVADGYLSGLEYAWFTDDPPSALPNPAQLVVV
jgi:hypothetical protein